MKKILSFVLCFVMVAMCAVSMASCSKDDKEYVAIDAGDLITEDFGIAVKKSDTTLTPEINKVINEWVENGNMKNYIEYYTKLSDYVSGVDGATKPDAGDLKVTWDFGAATETITVYTESGFAPFEFLSGSEIVGLDIAIMNEVAVNMGKKIEVKDIAFDTIVLSVQNSTGLAVGAAGLTINDERKESVDFSNIYYSTTLVIVSEKSKSIKSVKDLAGLKVGVQEGTSGDIIISDASGDNGYVYEVENDDGTKSTVTIKAAGAEVKKYKQYALAFADLKNGRIDAILMDKLPAQSLLKTVND